MSATKLQTIRPEVSRESHLTRRTFLKVVNTAGAGLVLGISWTRAAGAVPSGVFEPNVFLSIATDGQVTLIAPRPEMGQGVNTSLPMLIAEELECDWKKVRVEFAVADKKYGPQDVGGSESIRGSWKPLREAGAAAREMLIAAAALQWGVAPDECRAENSFVLHSASGRKAGYGELAEAAAKLTVPKEPKVKDPSQFRLLGKRIPRVDTPHKVDGSAKFGIDMRLDGMVFAALARCPVFGGKLKSFDGKRAKAFAGVRDVVQIGDTVAVLADNSWSAIKGRDALNVQWDDGGNGRVDSAAIRKQMETASTDGAFVFRNEGDVAAALSSAPKQINAVYEVPFLSHAPMEPQNCLANVQKDRAEVWVSTQIPQDLRETVAKIAGLPVDKVTVHFMYLGGGFGRRLTDEYAAEAALVSKTIGAPVKLIWSREDDVRFDFYRPATMHRMSGAAGADGMPTAFRHVVVGPSILNQLYGGAKDGKDPVLATQTPYCYATPNVHLGYVMSNTHVPVGWWRSVYASQCGFATECFVDELAQSAKKDPFEFRRALLAGDRSVTAGDEKLSTARLRGVLELAAAKASWGTPLAVGRGRGIACYPAFGSYIAHAAEVSVEDQSIKVHRVVCALDCGLHVNEDTIEAQMQGSVAFALSMLKQAITISGGRVEQTNFNNFSVLRINEMPKVEVHLVKNNEAPGGVGEPGVASVIPAVLNAVFAATGKRLRRLPVRPEDLA